MVTPRDEPQLLSVFLRWRRLRLAEGASLQQVARELSTKYACSTSTVRRFLDADYGDAQRTSSRLSQRRSYSRKKVGREKSRKRREQQGDYVRGYEAAYRRLTRTPVKHLVEPAFSDRETATLDEITATLRSVTSQNWRPRSIEKILQTYAASEQNGSQGQPYLSYDSASNTWRYGADPERSGGKLPLLLVLFVSPVSLVLILGCCLGLWSASRQQCLHIAMSLRPGTRHISKV